MHSVGAHTPRDTSWSHSLYFRVDIQTPRRSLISIAIKLE